MRYIRKVIGVLFLISIVVFVTAAILLKLRQPYNDSLVIEAGSKLFSPAYFFVNLNDDAVYETPESEIELNHVGVNNIKVKLKGFTYKVSLQVVDTISPNVVGKEKYTVALGKTIAPSDLIQYYNDATDVTFYFGEGADITSEGEHSIEVCAKDEGGNVTSVFVTVNVVNDTMPPGIYGARNRVVRAGSVVRYRDEVYVVDDYDENVELNIDTQQMNVRVVGDYPVTYYACDSSGNESRITVTFSVIEATEEKVPQEIIDEKFREIYGSITNESMTKVEKASAIYDYVSTAISFYPTSDKSDWEQNAYKGVTTKEGDCYTYYSVSRKLFEMAGIENMCIKRSDRSDVPHYWNMINCGDGWYHYDACPRGQYSYIRIFMYTDKQMELYSQNISPGYYDFDRELYPRTP